MESRFYIAGGTLPPTAESYVVRQSDEQLRRHLLQRDYCYVLNARQMGKSSLCVRTVANLRSEGARTVFLDLTKFGSRNLTAEQWYLALLTETGRELGLRDELMAEWRSNPDAGPMRRFFSALQDTVLSLVSEPVYVLVDEIDVTRSLPFSTDEFFAAIRQCFVGRASNQRLERLVFCLFGTATPAELIQDTKTSPFNIGRRVELKDFTRQEAAPLAAGLGANGAALLDRIFYWTNGHPYLTQRLCQSLVEAGTTTPRAVDRICSELFLVRKARESDDNLAFVRNRLLKNEADLASLLDQYEKLRSGRTVPDDESNPLLAILKMSGVCASVNGRLLIRNRIYARVFDREWVESQLPDAELRRQRTAYRRGLLRATAVASLLIAAFMALAAYGFIQARTASRARDLARLESRRSDQLTKTVSAEATDLKAALAKKDDALLLAESRRRQSEKDKRAALSAQQEAKREEARAVLAAEAEELQREAADRATALSNQRLSRELVTSGIRELQTGDPARALSPLVDALAMDTKDPERSDMHRYRLAMAIREATGLRQIWWGSKSMIDARFTPDGKSVIGANADGTVSVWDVQSGKQVGRSVHAPSTINDFAMTEDGSRFAVACDDTTARIYDIRTQREIGSPMRHGLPATGVAFSPNGRYLATGCGKGHGKATADLWDGSTGRFLRELGEFMSANSPVPVFSPNGRTVAYRFKDYITYGADALTGNSLGAIGPCWDCPNLEFDPKGDALALVGAFDVSGICAELCNPWDGSVMVHYTLESANGNGHRIGFGGAVAFSPDGRRLAIGTGDGVTRIWDVAEARPLTSPMIQTACVQSIRFSPDGSLVATASQNGSVQVWDSASGEPIGAPLWTGGSVNRVSFDPTGRLLLCASTDGSARLWELGANTTRAFRVPTPTDGLDGLTFSEDSQHLYARQNSTPLWDYRLKGREATRVEMAGWSFVDAAAHDRLLIADSRHVTVWNAATERRECPLLAVGQHPHQDLDPASIEAEGRYVAYEASLGLVEIRRVDKQGSLIGRFRVSKPVGGLIITTDAAMVVASCADGTVAQWVRATGMVTSRRDFPGQTASVSATPGGTDVLAHVYPSSNLSDTELLEPSGKRSWFKVKIHAVIPCRDGYAITLDRPAHLFAVWNLNRGRLIRTIPFIEDPFSVFISPTDDLFMVRSPIPRILDLRTGLPLSGRLAKGEVTAACFSRDGKRLAIATSDWAVTVFEVASHRSKRLPVSVESEIRGLSFSNDGRFLATMTATSVQVWDSTTGEPITLAMNAAGQPLLTPLFSQDGSLVAVPGAQAIDVLRMQRDDRRLPELRNLAFLMSRSSGDASTWQMLRSKFAGDFKFVGSRPTAAGTRMHESDESRIYNIERYISLSRSDGDSLLTFAGAAARIGEWPTAADAARRCLALNGSDPAALFMLAEAELHLGRYEEAAEHFKQARTAFPSGRYFESLRQKSYLRAGDYRPYALEMQSIIEPLSDTDQGEIERGSRAIQAAYLSGDRNLTLSIANKVFAPVREGRASSDIELLSSVISLIPGLEPDYGPALPLARTVYEGDRSPGNRLTLALLLYRNARAQEALSLADSDPTLQTSDDVVLKDAVEALCLTALHRPDEAKLHLDRVLARIKEDLRPGQEGGAADIDERFMRLVLQKQLEELRVAAHREAGEVAQRDKKRR